LPGKAAFAEDVQYRDDRFFAGVRQDRQSDGTLLDVHDARARIALRKDCRRR
jgi:hypothetical protein